MLAETLTRLLLDQPTSEEDPIQWGWTLPG